MLNQDTLETKRAYTDQYIWGLVATPFVSLALSYMNDLVSAAVSIVLTIFFVARDRNVLLANGLKAPSVWWFLISFVYIYRRGSLNNQPSWKKVSIITVVAYIAIVIAVTLHDSSNTSASAGKAYCGTVTEILRDNNYDAKCLKVRDIREVSDNHYRAVAMLDNGNDLNIAISFSDREHYEVSTTEL
jgi:hypothetical protein